MNANDAATFALEDSDFDTELDHAPWDGGVARSTFVKHDDDVLTGAVAKASAVEGSERARALGVVAEALAVVRGFMLSAEHRELFEPGGLLEPYLASVRLWAIEVAVALAARDLVAPRVFVWMYERAVREQARLETVLDALPDDLVAALHELMLALSRLERAMR